MDEDFLGLGEYFAAQEAVHAAIRRTNSLAKRKVENELEVMDDEAVETLAQIKAWRDIEQLADRQKRTLVRHAVNSGVTATAAGKAAGVSHVSAKKWASEEQSPK